MYIPCMPKNEMCMIFTTSAVIPYLDLCLQAKGVIVQSGKNHFCDEAQRNMAIDAGLSFHTEFVTVILI